MREIAVSQAPLSSNSDRHDGPEMLGLVRRYFATDAPLTPLRRIVQAIKDPFQDGKDGHFRVNPLWVILGSLAALAFAVFLYFNLGRL